MTDYNEFDPSFGSDTYYFSVTLEAGAFVGLVNVSMTADWNRVALRGRTVTRRTTQKLGHFNWLLARSADSTANRTKSNNQCLSYVRPPWISVQQIAGSAMLRQGHSGQVSGAPSFKGALRRRLKMFVMIISCRQLGKNVIDCDVENATHRLCLCSTTKIKQAMNVSN